MVQNPAKVAIFLDSHLSHKTNDFRYTFGLCIIGIEGIYCSIIDDCKAVLKLKNASKWLFILSEKRYDNS